MELRTFPTYYPTSIEYDIFQGHALCSTCGQLLSFPIGSALVQCPLCKTVVSLRPMYTMAIGGQTRCSGCHQNMLFPLGATAVQCTNCSSITQCPRLQHFSCCGCGLHLAYCASSDMTSVLCTVCNTLRDIVSIEMESFSMEMGHKRVQESVPGPMTSSSDTTSQVSLHSSLAFHSTEEDSATIPTPPVEHINEEESKSSCMQNAPSC